MEEEEAGEVPLFESLSRPGEPARGDNGAPRGEAGDPPLAEVLPLLAAPGLPERALLPPRGLIGRPPPGLATRPPLRAEAVGGVVAPGTAKLARSGGTGVLADPAAGRWDIAATAFSRVGFSKLVQSALPPQLHSGQRSCAPGWAADHMRPTIGILLLALSAARVFGFSLPDAPPSDVLLRARISQMDRAACATWLQRRGFAAVLPIQPMLMKPLEEPLCGLELTFRRKPNSEKGGKDGGLRFTLSTGSQSEEAADDACGELLVTRISEGQYCDKLFSEKLILKKVTTDLAKLPVECGEVLSVVNLMDASQ